jgi:hypothetical protein
MNKEFQVCRLCRVNNSCHPDLLPVFVGRSGRPHTIKDKEKYMLRIDCGNYTCGLDGETAARAAIKHDDGFKSYPVTEQTGEIHEVEGIAFGTSNKRTDINEHRIVTREGQIYARQSDMYFPTQRIPLLDEA